MSRSFPRSKLHIQPQTLHRSHRKEEACVSPVSRAFNGRNAAGCLLNSVRGNMANGLRGEIKSGRGLILGFRSSRRERPSAYPSAASWGCSRCFSWTMRRRRNGRKKRKPTVTRRRSPPNGPPQPRGRRHVNKTGSSRPQLRKTEKQKKRKEKSIYTPACLYPA